jgi:hypothetical protein
MVTFIQGNLLEIESGIICHQVNCRKVAGAGLAKQISNKWPEWYTKYKNVSGYLGLVSWHKINDDLWLADLYAQDGFGRDRRYTNYAAFGKCLLDLSRTVDATKLISVYLPKYVGCGLAGGDWQIVYRIIEDALPNAIIVELSQRNLTQSQPDLATCGDCGNELQPVRPGKYQCNHCESRQAGY